MKTKTSLLTALIAFAGGASLMAQVYSVNVVGYVNAPVQVGFNLLSNPLVNGTNGLAQVLPTVTNGTRVYKRITSGPDAGNFSIDIYNGGVWYDEASEAVSTTTLSPGEGFFVLSSVATNITFVGEVKTGSTSVPLNSGFNLIASVVPQRYELISPDFPVVNGYQHYKLKPDSTYAVSVYNNGWFDIDSELPVQVYSSDVNTPAQGFFILNPGSATTWSRTFNL